VLVCRLKLDAGVIARFPTWRVIGRYGAGFDNVDVDAASRAGIAVVNLPDYCVEEAATHAAALVLAATRRLFEARRLVDVGGWRDPAPLLPMPRLSRCTLGLVGAGRIGTEVIRLLGPFFAEVIAHTPSRRVPPGARWAELETVFAQSDVVSLHCPLTLATANLVDAARLASMKPGALLVNVSRGGLMDAVAVAEALRSGRLGGLAVDVLPTEPPPLDEPLLTLPNVICTNHIAWFSDDSPVRLRQLLAERCAAYLVGQPVPSVVNAAALAALPR
jgi:D-3-phosphoglycerate dehydrogenase / 2-oxoglutarate reductase